MGCHKNKPVVVNVFEFFLKPAQLLLADASFVTAVAAHIARISLAIALIIDIVEDHKKSVCIFEGVIGGPKNSLKVSANICHFRPQSLVRG